MTPGPDSNGQEGDGIQPSDDANRPDAVPMSSAALPMLEPGHDVALAAAGDGAAFERLYRLHVPRVQSLARWLLGTTDVDDAVQEVFIRVWQKLHTYSGQAAFSTWLHRVAVNLILRRRQSRAIHRDRFVVADPGMERVAGRTPRPDLRVALEQAVEHLPAGAREVFVLHDMEGYKHDEIGSMLGVDPGTSRSQLHRARRLLRERLEA
mgnify:CR=1 FL=1